VEVLHRPLQVLLGEVGLGDRHAGLDVEALDQAARGEDRAHAAAALALHRRLIADLELLGVDRVGLVVVGQPAVVRRAIVDVVVRDRKLVIVRRGAFVTRAYAGGGDEQRADN
jgi:hypothetical protein